MTSSIHSDLKWSHIYDYCLSLTPDSKFESRELVNYIEKLGHSGKIVPLEEQKNSKYENHIFEFSNQTEDRGYPWRSCILEGQLPHFLYWPI